jgi:hypothetical protein
MTPLWAQIRTWLLATLERANAATRMGLSLYHTFIAAGLPAPELRLGCAVGGGDPYVNHARASAGVLMERFGITTVLNWSPTRSRNVCKMNFVLLTRS